MLRLDSYTRFLRTVLGCKYLDSNIFFVVSAVYSSTLDRN
uniref:Uncharacterized protein n=1 Tax=Anguilla anguilla TaxID=7936 RepID=A0A0E9UL89_ANGAN